MYRHHIGGDPFHAVEGMRRGRLGKPLLWRAVPTPRSATRRHLRTRTEILVVHHVGRWHVKDPWNVLLLAWQVGHGRRVPGHWFRLSNPADGGGYNSWKVILFIHRTVLTGRAGVRGGERRVGPGPDSLSQISGIEITSLLRQRCRPSEKVGFQRVKESATCFLVQRPARTDQQFADFQ